GEAVALPDEVEHRLLAHRGDAARHLAVDDDAERAEGDDPEQAVAELAARIEREDQLADLDEAADSGEDAEKELERLLHGARSCTRFARRSSSCAAALNAPSARWSSALEGDPTASGCSAWPTSAPMRNPAWAASATDDRSAVLRRPSIEVSRCRAIPAACSR